MALEDMSEKHPVFPIPWKDVEAALHVFEPARGGNSSAHRGVVTISHKQKVFVKIGVDDYTMNWAKKEIESYAFLHERQYPYIPAFLSANADKTGFAIDALLPEDGWDWSDTWDANRLKATLAAMDALAVIMPDPKDAELLKPIITDDLNGWNKLVTSPKQQARLVAMLKDVPDQSIMADLALHAERSSEYRVRHDTLVHDDVRADNCGWNPRTGEVKLVDWNWLELGDRRLDLAAFLVHVHQNGCDVLKKCADRLDASALHWMAGFWLESASEPMWPGGPEALRGKQLLSGLTALKLARELSLFTSSSSFE